MIRPGEDHLLASMKKGFHPALLLEILSTKLKWKAAIYTPRGTYRGICHCVNGVDISTCLLRTQTCNYMYSCDLAIKAPQACPAHPDAVAPLPARGRDLHGRASGLEVMLSSSG